MHTFSCRFYTKHRICFYVQIQYFSLQQVLFQRCNRERSHAPMIKNIILSRAPNIISLHATKQVAVLYFFFPWQPETTLRWKRVIINRGSLIQTPFNFLVSQKAGNRRDPDVKASGSNHSRGSQIQKACEWNKSDTKVCMSNSVVSPLQWLISYHLKFTVNRKSPLKKVLLISCFKIFISIQS